MGNYLAPLSFGEEVDLNEFFMVFPGVGNGVWGVFGSKNLILCIIRIWFDKYR